MRSAHTQHTLVFQEDFSIEKLKKGIILGRAGH